MSKLTTSKGRERNSDVIFKINTYALFDAEVKTRNVFDISLLCRQLRHDMYVIQSFSFDLARSQANSRSVTRLVHRQC